MNWYPQFNLFEIHVHHNQNHLLVTTTFPFQLEPFITLLKNNLNDKKKKSSYIKEYKFRSFLIMTYQNQTFLLPNPVIISPSQTNC